MPEVKVSEREGLTITYDSVYKEFRLRNCDSEEVGSGKTQEDVERQADKLSKQKFQFPILALAVNGLRVEDGKVTSLNIDGKTVWFVGPSAGRYSGDRGVRSNHNLRYCHIHEKTECNAVLLKKIVAQRIKVEEIEQDIKKQIDLMDKRMDLKYFGLEP